MTTGNKLILLNKFKKRFSIFYICLIKDGLIVILSEHYWLRKGIIYKFKESTPYKTKSCALTKHIFI